MDNRLKSVPLKVDIVVSRLSCDCSEEDMFQFLTDEGVEDIEVISHEDYKTQTYTISIMKNDIEKVLNENFWHEGIESRLFVHRRHYHDQSGRQKGQVSAYV